MLAFWPKKMPGALGCMLACCFVLSFFEGSGWLVSATCKNGHFALKPPKTIEKRFFKGNNACNLKCKGSQSKLVGVTTDCRKVLLESPTNWCLCKNTGPC